MEEQLDQRGPRGGLASAKRPVISHELDLPQHKVVARRGLFERLGAARRVTVVSAPPGSGKTVMLRSWISEADLADRSAWVAAGRDERDPRRFWLAVVDALRRTAPGSVLVQALTAAPDLDGWTMAERLLTDLAPLARRVWLVIDDVHELDEETLRQLELLIMRAPAQLRFVLATRHDVRLGLHRLRLVGELTEIRGADLRFTVAEARELFEAAGVELPEPAVTVLQEQTEGWAAGLRLAALSLAGRPDPASYAAEFSGTERTVAEYLLAEVLDRQPERVRRMLLRTSVLERVNGELADLLTGEDGGERVLQDLEEANAFVVSLNVDRCWFRYHQMFADLLQLELRRTAPEQVTGLHRAAAGWFAEHGFAVEAIRHAQAGRDWETAGRLLADHWPGLYLDGQAAITRDLLAGFPAGARVANAELAVIAAAAELAQGSLEAAERFLGLAERGTAPVPDTRKSQAQLLLGITRLLLARQRGNLTVAAEQARRLQAITEAPDPARYDLPTATQTGLLKDLRALALINLGITEYWTARTEQAEQHLEHGVTLARQNGRPFLEFTGLAYQAAAGFFRSFSIAAELGSQAFQLARQHGWTDEPGAGTACATLGTVLAWQGRFDEAETWVQRAERTLQAEAEPAARVTVYHVRGMLELARGRDAEALATFRAAEPLAARLAAPNYLLPRTQTLLLLALVRLGEAGLAEQARAGLDDHAGVRITTAMLRLLQKDPRAATDALAPVLDGSLRVTFPTWLAGAFLLESDARDCLGQAAAAEQALERALDLAEPDGALLWFLLHPAPDLLRRQARRRTSHSALIADILSLIAGNKSAPRPPGGSRPPAELLSDSELRLLRYLPTNMTAPEIADELSVSRNTVKTHMRNLYAKLGTHRRAETVQFAREMGLLAPRPRG